MPFCSERLHLLKEIIDLDNVTLSRLIGTSASCTQSWYDGVRYPDPEFLGAIAIGSGISADWIVGLSEEENKVKLPITISPDRYKSHKLKSYIFKYKKYVKSILGDRINSVKLQTGFNFPEFCGFIDKSSITRRWIHGEVSPRTENLIVIANTFSITMDYLLGLDSLPVL